MYNVILQVLINPIIVFVLLTYMNDANKMDKPRNPIPTIDIILSEHSDILSRIISHCQEDLLMKVRK
jgi:hypothetical protein